MTSHAVSRRFRWFRGAAPLLGVWLCLALAGCGDIGGSGSADVAPVAAGSGADGGESASPTAGGPRLSFAKTTHDFGEISDTQTYFASFPFTNTGSEQLVISDVKAACGCTVPTLRKYVFAPGEGDSLDIRFDPKGKQGPTPKYITVISNASPESEIRLEITSDIKPLLECDRFVRLGTVPLGEGHRRLVPVAYRDPDTTIGPITVNNPHVTAELIESGVVDSSSGDAVTYRGTIEVTVAPQTPWGLIFATRMTIPVTGRPTAEAEPVDHSYTIYLTGNVFGEIHAQPGILGLGRMQANTPFEKSLSLTRPSGEPFRILDVAIAESTLPGIDVRAVERGPAAHDLVISGSTAAFRGSIRGIVRVTTDLPGEEELTVRFSGSVG
jgi:hypothetical protein